MIDVLTLRASTVIDFAQYVNVEMRPLYTSLEIVKWLVNSGGNWSPPPPPLPHYFLRWKCRELAEDQLLEHCWA